MIDSTAFFVPTTIMLCCSWAICLSAAACSENDHGNMNLASNTAPVSSTRPSKVAAIQTIVGCRFQAWRSRIRWPVLALVPGEIELFGGEPELNDELAGEIRWWGLAALFLPQPDQGILVAAHNDAGVGAAHKILAVWFKLVIL